MPEIQLPSLELHGAPTGNCFRVAVCLEVLGIEYAPRFVDLGRLQHFGPDFLNLNPFGRVPVLVDRSAVGTPLVLTQSNAILFHLCALKPGVLLPDPADPKHAKVLERFFYFVTDVIAPNYSSFFLANHGNTQGSQMLGYLALEAMVAAERFLADGPYVAGDDFSLADISALTVISANRDRVDWHRAPRLREWLDRVLDRADVQKGLAAFSLPDPR